MSAGKLDQSLDQIMQDKPAGGRRGGKRPPPRRAKSKAKSAIITPAGGIQKNKATSKAAPKSVAPTLTATTSNESKIIVSNLPEDVTETQIKDYFGQTIGGVKRAMLTYGPNGRSRGVATIIFRGGDSAQKAAKQLDGVKVDGKPMKIEVVVGAKQAPTPSAPKKLADRVSQPKNAAKDKPKTNGAATTNGAAKGKSTRTRKPARTSKPKKKTAEELDAEMQDYFGGDGVGANAATAQPAAAQNAGADTGMVDEVL